MNTSVKYLENVKINIDELIEFDNIIDVYKHIFKLNNYNTLPFIITDKKKKSIRFLENEENYINDKNYVYLNCFLNCIRNKVIRLIDKSKLYSNSNKDGDFSKELYFLNIILKDFDVKTILKIILTETTE